MGAYSGPLAAGASPSPVEEAEALKAKLAAAEDAIAALKARLEALAKKD